MAVLYVLAAILTSICSSLTHVIQKIIPNKKENKIFCIREYFFVLQAIRDLETQSWTSRYECLIIATLSLRTWFTLFVI